VRLDLRRRIAVVAVAVALQQIGKMMRTGWAEKGFAV
jgi:hypothetical protein